MKDYTIKLATYIPFIQTVKVQAENHDDAIHLAFDNMNKDSWVRNPEHVIEDDEVEVENIDPLDLEEEEEEEEDLPCCELDEEEEDTL